MVLMRTATEQQKPTRLTLRKNWRVWQKLAGVWRAKHLTDPVKWQRRVRAERA